MTTSVKVHVNGKYRATVTQDGGDPVTIEGNYNGGSGERYFTLPHPASGTFTISEVPVADGDERDIDGNPIAATTDSGDDKSFGERAVEEVEKIADEAGEKIEEGIHALEGDDNAA